MKTVLWTTSANRHPVEIADYVAEESIEAAEAFVNRIDQHLTLAEFPE